MEFSDCSVRCGGGFSTAKPVCVSKKNNGEVPDKFCSSNQRPDPMSLVCNKQECSPKWQLGEWSSCNGCVHQPGVQERKVWCAHESPEWEEIPIVTDEKKCLLLDGRKPNTKQVCSKLCDSHCPRRKGRSIENGFGYWGVFQNTKFLLIGPENPVPALPENYETFNEYDDSCELPDNPIEPLEFEEENDNDGLDFNESYNDVENESQDEEEMESDYPNDEISICDAQKNQKSPKEILILKAGDLNLRKKDVSSASRKGEVFDRIPDSRMMVVEIPEVVREDKVLSDEAYRKLGDKVSRHFGNQVP